jgi:uncharacterized iron-regulated protein
MMKKFFVVLLTAISICCVAQEGMENHFKIFDTRARQITTIENIAAGLKDADVLFFGEEHNDSAGHYLKAEIFKVLHQLFGADLALSLEMFETDCQLVLDEYLAGHISEERMIKEARAWNNYKDYRPLVEYAKRNRLDVIAANPPRRYVNMVSRRGMQSLDSLPKASKKYLPPLPYDTLGGRYREKFMEFMRGGSPGTGNFRMYYSQNLWDAGMAWSIYRYHKKNKRKKIFHCVGRFHSDEKLGTVAQLQKRNPKLGILNISCFSNTSFADPDWEKFSHLGDYIILTDPDLKKTF